MTEYPIEELTDDQLEKFEATDTAPITVNKTTAEVTDSIGGKGTIELGES